MIASENKLPFFVKASLLCIGLVAFITMLSVAQTIILPIIYSIIIAIVLSPMVNFLVKKKMNRMLAITLTILLVTVVIVSLLAVLSYQMMQFSDAFPMLVTKFKQLFEQSKIWTSDSFNISDRKLNLWIKNENAELLNSSSAIIGQTLINAGNILIILVLIPVYVFMILFYQPLLIEFIHKLFKSNNHIEINKMLVETKNIIQSYLVGLLKEAGIVALLNSAALLLLGVDYAILLGIIGAILNIIPYLGGVIAVALPMAIALATGSSADSLLVLVAYVLIQFIDNNYIIPKVVASKVKINALVSVVVVIAGGALWGVPGMFLSIPITAILKVIFDHIESLKPWGFLLGDTMPDEPIFKFLKKKN